MISEKIISVKEIFLKAKKNSGSEKEIEIPVEDMDFLQNFKSCFNISRDQNEYGPGSAQEPGDRQRSRICLPRHAILLRRRSRRSG